MLKILKFRLRWYFLDITFESSSLFRLDVKKLSLQQTFKDTNKWQLEMKKLIEFAKSMNIFAPGENTNIAVSQSGETGILCSVSMLNYIFRLAVLKSVLSN